MLLVQDIHKAFDGQAVLRGVSLAVHEGEIVVLLGPSGCGKTTLLRIIAGLETADQGRMLLNKDDLTRIPIHKRYFGMVFQDYALFPHKNVGDNVAFGLKMMGWAEERINMRVQQVLQLVGLTDFERRAIHDLSGGEQQRVAIARALAPFPRILLMDEPLGSLDRALRERLMGELRSILKRAGQVTTGDLHATGHLPPDNRPGLAQIPGGERMASIYVTHDQEEAFAIADQIMVMNMGVIEQAGSPIDLYRRPKTLFVARFLGMENIFEVEVQSEDPPLVDSVLGVLRIAEHEECPPGPANLLIRPEAATLVPPDRTTGPNIFSGQLLEVSFRGRHQVAEVEFSGKKEPMTLKFNFESSVSLPLPPSTVHIQLNPEQLRLLAPGPASQS